MEAETLVKLIGSGNTGTVEDTWLRLAESESTPLEELASYNVVLAELQKAGKVSQAATYAWTVIESVATRSTPMETLTVARPFLLAVGEGDELRNQVACLYRSAYEGREGLEALLTEAGIEGGRPVRRALRTLEVALAVKEGSYLVSRDDEDIAVRLDAIDRSTWECTIHDGRGEETLGVVLLADRYAPALPADFHVLRCFAREELTEKLAKDPASVVIDLCRSEGNQIESGRLEALVRPLLTDGVDWKKWFTRTRTALKRCPNIKLEGRSPYVIRYTDALSAPEDVLRKEFDAAREPIKQFSVVEAYLRVCKTAQRDPSPEALNYCRDSFRERASRLPETGMHRATLLLLMARHVGESGAIDTDARAVAAHDVLELFRRDVDAVKLIEEIEDASLLELACTTLVEARPDRWPSDLADLLPSLPIAVCDFAASKLLASGTTQEEFTGIIQRILSKPVPHFEALLWLWDGPTQADQIGEINALTVLTRILRGLDACKRDARVSKEQARRISQRARAVLGARKLQRFCSCLDGLEPGMASAVRTQLRRLDNLGRAVRDDMLRMIDRKFPSLGTATAVEPPWLRDDVLYVTREGLAKKQAEIEHHVSVKIKENARAIGNAAERGDLSENSEYKFALEERDLLSARLGQMNAEMSIAKVITPQDVPDDHIGVGTRVVFRHVESGERYEMTFAGSWDADVEKGWFNYKAPLALSLMGKRVGQTIELSHQGASGIYEIVELHSALAKVSYR